MGCSNSDLSKQDKGTFRVSLKLSSAGSAIILFSRYKPVATSHAPRGSHYSRCVRVFSPRQHHCPVGAAGPTTLRLGALSVGRESSLASQEIRHRQGHTAASQRPTGQFACLLKQFLCAFDASLEAFAELCVILAFRDVFGDCSANHVGNGLFVHTRYGLKALGERRIQSDGHCFVRGHLSIMAQYAVVVKTYWCYTLWYLGSTKRREWFR